MDEIKRKHVYSYNKKIDQYGVHCLLKLITNTNKSKYIRITTKFNLNYSNYIPEKKILGRIERDGNRFSQLIEIRTSCISSYIFMSYEHYLKKKLPMCEIKLNQILYRDRFLISLINRDLPHPSINHYVFLPFNFY